MTIREFYEEWLADVSLKIESLEAEKADLEIQYNKLNLKCEIYESREQLKNYFKSEIEELEKFEDKEKSLKEAIAIYRDLRIRIEVLTK